VYAHRTDGFKGQIDLTMEGLPPGVTCVPQAISGSMKQTNLVLAAADNAAPFTGTVKVIGTAVINGQKVVQQARAATITWGVPIMQNIPTVTRLDRDLMLAAIERERPALTFLAYPNNPTGNLFSSDDVAAIIRASPGLVVVDEAYSAFADASFLPRIAEFPNLLVLRTLSKVGMAGIRLGYAIAAPEWIAQLNKLRAPYNVNAFTQAAAVALLADAGWMANQAATIRAERSRLAAAMAQLPGVTVFATQANFLLARVPEADRLYDGLKERRILVKNVHSWHPLLANCLRVTVGTPGENDALLAALKGLLPGR
jgi:histidinol-phosphate aminotransferase